MSAKVTTEAIVSVHAYPVPSPTLHGFTFKISDSHISATFKGKRRVYYHKEDRGTKITKQTSCPNCNGSYAYHSGHVTLDGVVDWFRVTGYSGRDVPQSCLPRPGMTLREFAAWLSEGREKWMRDMFAKHDDPIAEFQ